ncbi:unnamed protein product [Linum tenue]|uniref:Uncharacterized protein n=1 Tax=Linum tenue TaxID=586396 RepID=A0AAV0LD09_9ROSI|nr:unnamed protein product [Linum tenue]CAI0432031.1 unnamed protein product [Linum tenue]
MSHVFLMINLMRLYV